MNDPLDGILARNPNEEGALIQVLQDVHRHYRYLPADALLRVSGHLGVPLARVYGVATFYRAFSLEPKGKHEVKVCMGTACHIRGAGLLLEEYNRRLDVHPGKVTDDGEFSLDVVNCVGACAMAPVTIVDGTYHGNARPGDVEKILEEARDGDR